MPKYSFECAKCGIVFSKIVSYDDKELILCPNCSSGTEVLPSLPQKVVVDEKADPYRNKSVKRGIGEIMKKRNFEHSKKHELGELVEKFGKDKIKKTSFGKGIK